MKNLLILIAVFTITSCGNSHSKTGDKNSTSKDTIPAPIDAQKAPKFNGTIVYKNHAEGDSAQAALFNNLAPSEYAVSVKGNKLRIKEIGGLTGLNLLINFDDSLYYQFDNNAKTVQRVAREDYGPYLAKIKIEETDETAEIMGYLCTKYKVISSPFVNAQSSQELWVTEAFSFPYEQGRYIGKNDFDGILPLPVICDIGFGTILKAVSVDRNTTVTMEAYVLETETLDENFEIPDNYEIKQ